MDMGLAEDLSRLAELKKSGVLTQQEFDRQKKRLLKGKRPWWMTALLWIIGLWCLVCLLAILVAIFVPAIRNAMAADEVARDVPEIAADASANSGYEEGIFMGRCLLEVGGRKYIDGQCPISMSPDGSFSIGAAESVPLRFFATVRIAGNRLAEGHWNEEEGANHAHTPLGELRFDRGCWQNQTAKVCAWK
jgi:Short C-terminal domain